jgi:hypothetical protein
MDNYNEEPYPHLIGLTGKPRAGKSEVASILERDHGYVRLSVADPIRQALSWINPWVSVHGRPPRRLSQLLRDSDWRTVKDNYPEVRRLLQVLGTDVARELWNEDFWLRTLVERIHDLRNERIVVDDVRFANETEAIHELGGFIVRIDRPHRGHLEGSDLGDFVAYDPHYERGDLPADLVLFNTFDLDTLTVQVGDVLGDLDLLVAA